MNITKKRMQHSLKIIRRFDEDILGRLAKKEQPSRVLNYIFEVYQNNYKYRKLLSKRAFFFSKKKTKFLYKVVTDEREFKRKKRTMKINSYLNILKLRSFYGYIGARKFKRLFTNFGIHSNILGRSFAYFLEGRLDVILYRANFFDSIYSARQYINHKKVFINGQVVDRPSYKVFLNDIITVQNPEAFYIRLKNKLEKNEILVNYPPYLEVNYKLGAIMLIKIPVNSEVPYPFFMNLNTIAHTFLK